MTSQPVSFSQCAGSTGQEVHAARPAKASAGAPPQTAGVLWFGGWLFTIGFAKLAWWKALLGLVAWPYFLGVAMH